MKAHEHTTSRRLTVATVPALALAFTVGCSTGQPHAAGTSPVQRTSHLSSNQVLAAADSLGFIVFGNAPAVAKPKRPAHWSLAQAQQSP